MSLPNYGLASTGGFSDRPGVPFAGTSGVSDGEAGHAHETGSGRYAARVSVSFGTRVSIDTGITSVGLLAAGVLVSRVLLSTAVLVAVATREAIRD